VRGRAGVVSTSLTAVRGEVDSPRHSFSMRSELIALAERIEHDENALRDSLQAWMESVNDPAIGAEIMRRLEAIKSGQA
jgi:hypothetical protein